MSVLLLVLLGVPFDFCEDMLERTERDFDRDLCFADLDFDEDKLERTEIDFESDLCFAVLDFVDVEICDFGVRKIGVTDMLSLGRRIKGECCFLYYIFTQYKIIYFGKSRHLFLI